MFFSQNLYIQLIAMSIPEKYVLPKDAYNVKKASDPKISQRTIVWEVAAFANFVPDDTKI